VLAGAVLPQPKMKKALTRTARIDARVTPAPVEDERRRSSGYLQVSPQTLATSLTQTLSHLFLQQ
jgi:hypothetical protein